VIAKLSAEEYFPNKAIELGFDEKVQHHFFKVAPSENKSVGAFALSTQKLRVLKFSIII
jgi:hypothetical protein